MPQYPRNLQQRYGHELSQMRRQMRRQQARTAGIDSGWPLAALPAVIDPAYTSGDPHCYINGSTTLTGPYQHLASYAPTAGDAVLVIPVGVNQTYVVLGRVS